MTHRIRAARLDDLDALYEMAKLTGGGFTNLPADRETLGAKLERSNKGFSREGEEPAEKTSTPGGASSRARASPSWLRAEFATQRKRMLENSGADIGGLRGRFEGGERRVRGKPMTRAVREGDE